jgi:hypothetical protein
MKQKYRACIVHWDTCVDLVVVAHGLLGASLVCAKRLARDETLAGELNTALSPYPNRQLCVQVCLPRNKTLQHTLQFPASVLPDLAEVLPLEVPKHIPIAGDGGSWGYREKVVGDTKPELHVVLSAARNETIEESCKDLNADVVTSVGAGLAEYCGDIPSLLVICDERSTEFLLYKDELLIGSRLIPSKADEIDATRFVALTRQFLESYKKHLGDEGISRILLGGPRTLHEEARATMGLQLGLDAVEIELPEGLQTKTNPDAVSTEAIVLATEDVIPSQNLLKAENQPKGISKRTAVVAALLILIFGQLAYAGFSYVMQPGLERKKVKAQIEELKDESVTALAYRDRLRKLNKRLRARNHAVTNHQSVLTLLNELSLALPKDSYLTKISFKKNDRLQIHGNSKTAPKIPSLFKSLSFVKAVEKPDFGKTEGEYQQFSLIVIFKDGAHKNVVN